MELFHGCFNADELFPLDGAFPADAVCEDAYAGDEREFYAAVENYAGVNFYIYVPAYGCGPSGYGYYEGGGWVRVNPLETDNLWVWLYGATGYGATRNALAADFRAAGGVNPENSLADLRNTYAWLLDTASRQN